jgi:anti-anti-sigma factor
VLTVTGDSLASFEIIRNTLRVRGEVGHEEEKELEKAIRELLDTGHASLVIDLSLVGHMGSSAVRHIATALVEAKEAGCPTTIRGGRGCCASWASLASTSWGQWNSLTSSV